MKFLQKLNKREKRLLFITIAIVSGVALYIYCIEPLWNYWNSLDSTINNLTKQLQRSYIILSRAKSIEAQYAVYESKLKVEGSDQEKTAQILRQIETTARNNRVHINDINPQEIQDEEFHKYYVIEVEAEADVLSLLQFVYDLQVAQQALKVTRIQIAANSARPYVLKTDMLITKVVLQ